MSLIWDCFEDEADRDPTPDEKSYVCEECGSCADLGLRDYRDEFGVEQTEWLCGSCFRRLMGGRLCL